VQEIAFEECLQWRGTPIIVGISMSSVDRQPVLLHPLGGSAKKTTACRSSALEPIKNWEWADRELANTSLDHGLRICKLEA
jgi:hypothetical protein